MSADPTVPGTPLVFSGVVSNAGDTTLTNVTVYNNKPTNNTWVFGPVILAPGAWRAFTGSYIPVGSGPFVDTVIARGNDVCSGTPVAASATRTCPAAIGTNICLNVLKEIACVLPPVETNGQVTDVCGDFDKFAIGFRCGAQIPGFCYRITVRNCGSAALGSLRVVDDKLGDVTADFFPNNAASSRAKSSSSTTRWRGVRIRPTPSRSPAAR
jgi:hypothetical protein